MSEVWSLTLVHTTSYPTFDVSVSTDFSKCSAYRFNKCSATHQPRPVGVAPARPNCLVFHNIILICADAQQLSR